MKLIAVAAVAAALLGSTAGAAAVQQDCPRGTRPGRKLTPETFGAVITSGSVRLGINQEGHLNIATGDLSAGGTNTPYTGLRFLPQNFEYTAPGCLCEGWGASAITASSSAYFAISDEDFGGPSANVVLTSFTSTADSAHSIIEFDGVLRVEHNYYPSPDTPHLFAVDVTLTNIGAEDITELKYVRVMDWDMEPTAFDEYVELNPGNAVDLECLHDNGFSNPNPLGPNGGLNVGCLAPGSGTTDTGVRDHGAYFRFKFQDVSGTSPLSTGQFRTLKTYYGATSTRAQALSALSAVGAEAFSLAQANTGDRNALQGIFAFSGIGGTPIVTEVAECSQTNPCEHVRVSSEGTSVTLSFSETGPFTATCD